MIYVRPRCRRSLISVEYVSREGQVTLTRASGSAALPLGGRALRSDLCAAWDRGGCFWVRLGVGRGRGLHAMAVGLVHGGCLRATIGMGAHRFRQSSGGWG